MASPLDKVPDLGSLGPRDLAHLGEELETLSACPEDLQTVAWLLRAGKLEEAAALLEERGLRGWAAALRGVAGRAT